MAEYPIITESTLFVIHGVCTSCFPPRPFVFSHEFDQNLGEISEIEDEKVVLKGSFWEGKIPGTCCSARVEVVSTNFEHIEGEREFVCSKEDSSNIQVTVYNGYGQFTNWENLQDLAFFKE